VATCDVDDRTDEGGGADRRCVPPEIGDEVARYDAELAYLDERIADLFDELKARELYDETLIVVTSDHGEAFLEHGLKGHFNSLYEEEVHIPMMIRYPGAAIRGVEPAPTSLASVFNKVLGFLELPQPEWLEDSTFPGSTGRTLAELYLPDPELGGHHQVTMQALYSDDGLKAIRTVPPEVRTDRDERHELYDLLRDPGEHHDLTSTHPAVARQMITLLERWVRQAKARAPDDHEESVMTAELKAQLRSLGYLD
jgi:arylsulfatase A-like enzyme